MKMINVTTNEAQSETCHYQTNLKCKACLNLGENFRECFNNGKPNRRVLKSLSRYCTIQNLSTFHRRYIERIWEQLLNYFLFIEISITLFKLF